MPHADKGTILLDLARGAIAKEFGLPAHDHPRLDWLEKNGATFVTLTRHGQLRGCMGSLEARRPLIDDVRHNAVASAFRDPRFLPLSREEFADTGVEVSLLDTPEPIRFSSEDDALAQLRPGTDGLILEWNLHRATYLPQVWEQLADPGTFLAHLKNKAGLPDNFWSDDIRLSRYSVHKWREEEQHG